MKKILSLLLFLTFSFAEDKIITIGSTPTPYGEILAFSKPLFEARGYKLIHKEFSDYLTPNLALDAKELDANVFQHKPFLDEFNKSRGTKISSIGTFVLVPMAIYSNKLKNLDLSKLQNAKISIPNDPTNESRALELLESAKLITLDNSALKTSINVKQNPLNLEFIPLKAAQLPRSLDDVSLAVIPTNYALGAKLNPKKDGLFIEEDTKYAIIIAIRTEDISSQKAKLIKEVLYSNEVKEFIEKTFDMTVIPSFE